MMRISNKEIASAIYESAKGKSGVLLTNTLERAVQVLARRRLLSKSESILKVLEDMENREKGTIVAKVHSTRELHQQTKTHLAKNLEKRYEASKVILQEIIQEDLIGGIKIEVGDEVLDLSLKNKINRLRKYLIKNT